MALPDLTPLQSRFLALHAHHLVTKWTWHFGETMLRAVTERGRPAFCGRDELEDLVERGLLGRGAGLSVRVTEAGRAALERQKETTIGG